jgi:hypothetical protein
MQEGSHRHTCEGLTGSTYAEEEETMKEMMVVQTQVCGAYHTPYQLPNLSLFLVGKGIRRVE